MIKETVDAVRLAELEGDKVISTAKVNGQESGDGFRKDRGAGCGIY